MQAAVRAPDALEEAFELLRQQLHDREREVLHLQSKVTALEAASRVRMDGPLDMQAVTQQEEEGCREEAADSIELKRGDGRLPVGAGDLSTRDTTRSFSATHRASPRLVVSPPHKATRALRHYERVYGTLKPTRRASASARQSPVSTRETSSVEASVPSRSSPQPSSVGDAPDLEVKNQKLQEVAGSLWAQLGTSRPFHGHHPAVWNLRQELAEIRDQYKALLRESRENASWRREKSLQKACRQIRVLNEQVAMLYTEMTLMQARGDNCCSPDEDTSVVKPLLSGLRIILRSNVVQLENKRLKHELECANCRIRELLQEVETLARNRDRAFEELQRLRMTAFDRALRRRATGELIPVTPTRPRAEPEKKRRPVLVPRLYRVYMCILPSGPPPRRLEYNVNSLDVTFTLVGVALVPRRAFVTH
ncbi:hypothetical protein FOZ63_021446 [Perkinsus olseni]|uniref:Uncharacterized protein n=1 Tax=Perkinsus olseni TaxID=32597 RepID=A0A7J6R3K4_PEROL|nr:hypothetical protein FOZ63_021446 [Perkinsus olseni]